MTAYAHLETADGKIRGMVLNHPDRHLLLITDKNAGVLRYFVFVRMVELRGGEVPKKGRGSGANPIEQGSTLSIYRESKVDVIVDFDFT